jgi:hypothetical protein
MGMTLAALSAKGTSSTGDKVKASNFGASYTVAPGVTAMLSGSGKLDAETTTYAHGLQ